MPKKNERKRGGAGPHVEKVGDQWRDANMRGRERRGKETRVCPPHYAALECVAKLSAVSGQPHCMFGRAVHPSVQSRSLPPTPPASSLVMPLALHPLAPQPPLHSSRSRRTGDATYQKRCETKTCVSEDKIPRRQWSKATVGLQHRLEPRPSLQRSRVSTRTWKPSHKVAYTTGVRSGQQKDRRCGILVGVVLFVLSKRGQ